jgi:hypothetical protein
MAQGQKHSPVSLAFRLFKERKHKLFKTNLVGMNSISSFWDRNHL